MIRIGVLSLQGGVEEHLQMLRALPAVEVRTFTRPSELAGLDAVILPGGESTAIGKLAVENGLMDALRSRIIEGMPVWGTCAGMILLAREIRNDKRRHLAVMDITVDRNGYGAQLESFVSKIPIDGIEGGPFPLVFIRAPRILVVGPGVRVMASLNGEPIACVQDAMVATAFHPELSGDTRFHRWFVELARTSNRG
ncbi:MAG: pyridoxal 5'-phosphate synthase glutaminase subunit PdxT [Spirochaetales bacterium]|nr:MAG: pyridoxal 5'-phosphate synthase glutaminase subunit PdxT [Spirochaetales bacterium]